MFRIYPRKEVIVLKTLPYIDKNGVQRPERELQLLLGKEHPDGSRDGLSVMATSDEYVATWIKE